MLVVSICVTCLSLTSACPAHACSMVTLHNLHISINVIYIFNLPPQCEKIAICTRITMYSENAVTLGKLTQKCLKEAYFLPQNPSSYSKGYRFFNDAKYRVYDCPPPSESYNRLLSPIRYLAAAGNELPIIMECRPQDYLSQHWKQWLPAFPPVVFKSLDEGLRDNVPINCDNSSHTGNTRK